MRTISRMPGGGGNAGTCWAQIVANQGVMNGLAGVGFTQFYQASWIPLPVFFNVFSLTGYFIQYTWIQQTGATIGACLRYNHNLLNTETQAEGEDFYIMISNGRIDKTVGGGAQNTIGAATWVVAANDVLRMEVLTRTADVQIQTIRNGAILQTITDNAATRILQGGPAMQLNSFGASLNNATIANFSCGPLAALST